LPAILQVQYAGVYPLQKTWVTEKAGKGWLAMNIMAHDLPIDESPAFYEAQSAGPLKNYTMIGSESRDTPWAARGHAAERDALWERFHDETATLMADGARVLGMLWKSAWIAGNGPSIAANKIVAIEPSTLRELYENPAFVPSLTLDEIEPVVNS